MRVIALKGTFSTVHVSTPIISYCVKKTCLKRSVISVLLSNETHTTKRNDASLTCITIRDPFEENFTFENRYRLKLAYFRLSVKFHKQAQMFRKIKTVVKQSTTMTHWCGLNYPKGVPPVCLSFSPPPLCSVPLIHPYTAQSKLMESFLQRGE